MPRENLTVKRLESLKAAPVGERHLIMDGIMPNMGVRVTDKGQKTFVFVGRFPGSSNPTRRALGEYGILTLEEARSRARTWHALIAKGIDPKAQAEEERQAAEKAAAAGKSRAFEAVLERYIAARRRDGIRKVEEDKRDFERECLPRWKGKPVDEIMNSDIMAILESISDRGAQRQALNLAQKIGTFFVWCLDDELIEVSPYRAKKVRTAIGEKKSRGRVLTDDELRVFWEATDGLGAVYREVYRLLLLTGQRLNDIAQASIAEIDFEKKVLVVPAARFKSGRDHAVPLTADAMDLIKALPVWKDCKWLCSLDGKGPVTIGDKVKKRLDASMLKAMKETDPEASLPEWQNHDLRRSLRTRLSELDVMDEVAEAVIGHVPTTLVRTYNQSDRLRVKREALAKWERALRLIVGRSGADNIVSLVSTRA